MDSRDPQHVRIPVEWVIKSINTLLTIGFLIEDIDQTWNEFRNVLYSLDDNFD